MMRRLLAALALAGFIAAGGCSDQGTAPRVDGGGGGGGTPVSYAADIQPIWDGACLGCHGKGGNGGLDLRPGFSRDNLVGVASTGYAPVRVQPGEPLASLLYLKLTGQAQAGGIMPPAGSLDQASLDLVRIWITAGAADN